MNRDIKWWAYKLFFVALTAPLWTVVLAMREAYLVAPAYGVLGSIVLGVYNLVAIVPALVCLLQGNKKPFLYKVSIAFSIISICAMCLLALGPK